MSKLWDVDFGGGAVNRYTDEQYQGLLAAGLLDGLTAHLVVTIDDLREAAASKRRELVNGSATINVGERSISTWIDAESRGSATALVLASSLSPGLTAPWKASDGNFYTLTAAEIVALALGMMAYVQACFAAEADVLAAINAGAITTLDEIDAAPWPTGQ